MVERHFEAKGTHYKQELVSDHYPDALYASRFSQSYRGDYIPCAVEIISSPGNAETIVRAGSGIAHKVKIPFTDFLNRDVETKLEVKVVPVSELDQVTKKLLGLSR